MRIGNGDTNPTLLVAVYTLLEGMGIICKKTVTPTVLILRIYNNCLE